jgi:hypothetical protein
VLDISRPTFVQEVRPIVQPSGAGYSATVPSNSALKKGSRRLLALPSTSFLQPASLLFNQPSTLNQPSSANPGNAADLLIITHKSFLSLASLGTLVAQRQAQGFTVKVVDVEDLYDEFSYGAHTPQAITDFLARARTNWARAALKLIWSQRNSSIRFSLRPRLMTRSLTLTMTVSLRFRWAGCPWLRWPKQISCSRKLRTFRRAMSRRVR